MSDPLLLVTNDDGVESPGIRSLVLAVRPLGEVHVVAPSREASASSQSLSLGRSLQTRELERSVHAVEGTPADCVGLAVNRLLPRRPSLVLSGINRGANLAEDIFYSGTVGAAREASFLGIPALALSLAVRDDRSDFGPAGRFAARLAALVLREGLPKGTLLNVNVPVGQPEVVAFTVQGRRQTWGGAAPSSGKREWPIDKAPARDELSDVSAVLNGFISVTPLQADTTHHGALAVFHDWAAELRNGHKRPVGAL
jgi:5'-nucleotidase